MGELRVAEPRRILHRPLLAWFSLDAAAESCGEEAGVDAGQAAQLARREDRLVGDGAEVFGDGPDIFLGGHPVDGVEAGEIDGTRIGTQCFLAAQVEIVLEIRHHQLTQGTKHGFAMAQAGII